MKITLFPFRFTLRAKLILLSFAVLCIPYLGYEYLKQIEDYFRTSLQTSISDSAYAVAGALHNKSRLFPDEYALNRRTLYIHELNHQIQLDGYTDDWLSYIDWSDDYTNANTDKHFKLIVSIYNGNYYALLQVIDDQINFTNPTSRDAEVGDNVVLVYADRRGYTHRYYFSPNAPGKISPYELIQRVDEYGVGYETIRHITHISGVWQKTDVGYNLELKLPVEIVGDYLGLVVNDIDKMDGRIIKTITGTAGDNTLVQPGKILKTSEQIKQIIYTQGRTEGRRIWVLDQMGQVLASDGDLRRKFKNNAFNIFYTWLLPPAHEYFKDDLLGASRLQGEEVQQALKGKTQTRWRSSPDNKAVIVSAATPVWDDDRIIGVVVVEETTNTIQLMQRQVLANLFNKTFLIFVVAILLLFAFATRLSSRLARLSRETESVIDEYGRVQGKFVGSKADDEIGDLSKSFAAILEKLDQYNNYLEGMVRRLSHELRTPMAIVQSSIERLQTEDAPESREKCIQSAEQGLKRLNLLVTRLSEAARLEQALQNADKQEVNLGQYLKYCIDGYQLAHADKQFKLLLPDHTINYLICPDLFSQMLDKLVSNALDFSEINKPIEVALYKNTNEVNITITNQGYPLPEAMHDDLFNSMVSIREKKEGEEPHLGLGLYISRQIAEFHHARLSANNLDNKKGVCVTIKLPLIDNK